MKNLNSFGNNWFIIIIFIYKYFPGLPAMINWIIFNKIINWNITLFHKSKRRLYYVQKKKNVHCIYNWFKAVLSIDVDSLLCIKKTRDWFNASFLLFIGLPSIVFFHFVYQTLRCSVAKVDIYLWFIIPVL